MRREELYLRDVLTAAAQIAEFVDGRTADSFETDKMLRSAVVHQLTIIGEAVGRLSEQLRSRYPGIPWSDVRGLRNIVVHNYFGIDWAEVWQASVSDVPVLRDQIAEILRVEFPD
jgi:uncharacterized protein with HEPN domain